jgi:hypothetical protein
MTRPSTAAPILAVLAIVLLTLGAAYLGGYFWLGQRFDYDETTTRLYPQQWMASVFKPAAQLETWLTGIETWAQHQASPQPPPSP